MEIILKSFEKIQMRLKSDKIADTLHEDKNKCVMIVV
jgi:hypothetical protein